MANIKLTKNELKKQKDGLKMFVRYLPTLQLKKQQLQVEIRKIDQERTIKEEEQIKIKESINTWIALFSEQFAFETWIKIKLVSRDFVNIAGVQIPVLNKIIYEDIRYDLLTTPCWVDKGVLKLKEIVKCNIELEILKQQLSLLKNELQITSQRVNLFEKVMIPTAKVNIKKINVYLGDQQTAAVVRGKIAKINLIRGK